MRRVIASVCSALIVASLGVAMDVTAAHASTSGPTSFTGKLVAHTTDTGARNVLASVVRLRGLVNATGHIVERDNLPGDPFNVNRDDLVFPEGTLSLVNTLGSIGFTIDPQSCIGHLTIQQTSVFDHGTGIFTNVSGGTTGVATGLALASRAADGSCDLSQPTRFEIDNVQGTGTMTL